MIFKNLKLNSRFLWGNFDDLSWTVNSKNGLKSLKPDQCSSPSFHVVLIKKGTIFTSTNETNFDWFVLSFIWTKSKFSISDDKITRTTMYCRRRHHRQYKKNTSHGYSQNGVLFCRAKRQSFHSVFPIKMQIWCWRFSDLIEDPLSSNHLWTPTFLFLELLLLLYFVVNPKFLQLIYIYFCFLFSFVRIFFVRLTKKITTIKPDVKLELADV